MACQSSFDVCSSEKKLVMNIITGVFVDNAVETAKTQHDWLVQKQLELREKYVVEMREIFLDLDEDASGTMTLEELTRGLKDPRVQSYFTALGLELHDTARLFNLIDDDGSGDVSIDEFLDGCLRLKGEAKSIDMHSVIHQMRRLEDRISQWHGGEHLASVRQRPTSGAAPEQSRRGGVCVEP
mmetsp:Transcript_37526/g.100020  ORF Transcript_37526/g.100020 Transcript_37526/m.100020 type:complete len:183 (-) Transcript_37526:38-586(-)